MERDELAAWLRLALVPGIGPAGARKLLAAFGLPQHVFAQEHDALAAVAGPAGATLLHAPPPDLDAHADATARWLAEAPATRHLLTLGDPRYPPALLQTEDPPLFLFALGTLPAAWPEAVAVVGSRNPTPQGAANARQFARSLAQAGLTVVSGLALGVDGAAHEGALDGGAAGQLATIAVVGTGLDRVYPRRHEALAGRIAQHGLLVSEYLLGTPPAAANFPRRNRIIAALARGTLVVEAALQSGSLITARLAVEQGKEVFAIPGSIHSAQSRGCHALLRQGAKLVETAQDILEELRPAAVLRAARPAAEEIGMPGDEDGLLQALGHDPVSVDALCARTGLPTATLQARLLALELQGHVARLAGGLFQRVAAG